MQQQAGGAGTDHSGAIWVLGLLLVVAVAASSPYWQMVGVAIATGTSPTPKAGGSVTGLWSTLGAFVLVLLLAGLAEVSPGAGGLALMVLLALWLWFLLGHVAGIQSFFALFAQR